MLQGRKSSLVCLKNGEKFYPRSSRKDQAEPVHYPVRDRWRGTRPTVLPFLMWIPNASTDSRRM